MFHMKPGNSSFFCFLRVKAHPICTPPAQPFLQFSHLIERSQVNGPRTVLFAEAQPRLQSYVGLLTLAVRQGFYDGRPAVHYLAPCSNF